MGASCQRNVLKMGVGRGEEVFRKSCPYIRQLANEMRHGDDTKCTISRSHFLLRAMFVQVLKVCVWNSTVNVPPNDVTIHSR